MDNRKAIHLAKMNATKKGNEFHIHSKYSSLMDMINTRGMNIPPIHTLRPLIMVTLFMIKGVSEDTKAL